MDRGELVDGRFEIEQLVGSGGMGEIYRAVDRRDGGRVALKVRHLGAASDRAVLDARFVLEAEILAGLRHPGIVAHVAHGHTAAGAPYLAMEWLEGEDLASRLERGPLPAPEAERLGRHVAEALAVAHARGIVHRDVKPANLLLEGGRIDGVKILDFGVARAEGARGAATWSGALVGTPAYMAPEQARGDDRLDARADVFALGAVLFECLTGRAAFVAPHVMGVLARILLEDAPRVSELLPGVPPALDALVARMLEKDPEARPRDASAVAEALASLGAHGASAAALPARPSAPPPALGAGEQRLLCVVMSAPAGAEAATLVADEMEDATLRLRRVVERFGGRMESLAGGSVVAVLSGTSAATDLAARAARCAIAMRAEAPALPLSLATGRGIISERWPVGEVIDRALRQMDRGAPAGGPPPLHVDELTAALLPARFDVGGDGDGLLLHGEREAAPAARTLLGKATRCVGRDAELDLLEGALRGAVDTATARLVLVTAPAGVGKSRLLSELLQRIAGRGAPVTTWIARGDPMAAGSPFALLGQALRHAAGIGDREPRATAHLKLRARVRRHVPRRDAGRMAAFLGEIAGAPAPDGDRHLEAARRDPRVLADQLARAWEDLLEAETARGPLLLVLDDLHWGDLPSIRFVKRALTTLADRPWMVLGLARPEVHAQFPELWAEHAMEEVHLAHLSRDASDALVREALGDGVADDVARRLVELAAGNAFYLEELIRAAAAGRHDALPETVLAMAAARIEGLDPVARRVLRAATVFGQVFTRGGAEALLGGALSGAELGAVLAELVARELFTKRGEARRDAEQAYAFRHALLREAAYASLTEVDRALGHRLAGAWLERQGEGDPMVLAEHFERGREPARAGVWFRRAAEQALRGSDLDAATSRAERAAACGAEGESLGEIRAIQTEASSLRGRLEETLARGQQALALLPPGGELWCRAAGEVAFVLARVPERERIDPLLREIAALGADGQPEAHHLALWGRVVGVLFASDRRPAAEALHAQCEAHARGREAELGPIVMARLNHGRSWAALYREDAVGMVRFEEAALACFQEAGAITSACLMAAGLGAAYQEIGALADAERVLRDAVAEAERLGVVRFRLHAMHNLGMVLALRGALDEGRAVEEEALAGFMAERDLRIAAASRFYLARILMLQGDLDGAEREARCSVEVSAPYAQSSTVALAVLASVELCQGRGAAALEHARDAMDRLAALGHIEEGEALVRLAHAEALLATGRADEARDAAADARARLLARADRITEPAWRDGFLALPEHARTLALAAELAAPRSA
jgi:tetratricopeptide (TPR) repeat protein